MNSPRKTADYACPRHRDPTQPLLTDRAADPNFGAAFSAGPNSDRTKRASHLQPVEQKESGILYTLGSEFPEVDRIPAWPYHPLVEPRFYIDTTIDTTIVTSLVAQPSRDIITAAHPKNS